MDDAFRARAEARRLRGMWGGRTQSHEELDDLDLDYWLSVPPNERIRAACLLHEEGRTLRHDGPLPRLQGSPGGVRRVGS